MVDIAPSTPMGAPEFKAPVSVETGSEQPAKSKARKLIESNAGKLLVSKLSTLRFSGPSIDTTGESGFNF